MLCNTTYGLFPISDSHEAQLSMLAMLVAIFQQIPTNQLYPATARILHDAAPCGAARTLAADHPITDSQILHQVYFRDRPPFSNAMEE